MEDEVRDREARSVALQFQISDIYCQPGERACGPCGSSKDARLSEWRVGKVPIDTDDIYFQVPITPLRHMDMSIKIVSLDLLIDF